jgi:hypothetical protein
MRSPISTNDCAWGHAPDISATWEAQKRGLQSMGELLPHSLGSIPSTEKNKNKQTKKKIYDKEEQYTF